MEVIVGKGVGGSAAEAGGGRSVWLRRPPAARSAPPLTRERITEVAIALLDEEGMERLTMRRLAERLGVGVTTLYWHIDTKDDVLDLAIDAIFAEAGVPQPQQDQWRPELVAALTECRTLLLRHPWSSALPLRHRPSIGPRFLAWTESVHAILVRAGLTGQHVSAAFWLLFSHAQISAASQAALGWSTDELAAAREQLQQHRDQFPTIAEHGLTEHGWEENFLLGLRFAIDGIELHVASGRD